MKHIVYLLVLLVAGTTYAQNKCIITGIVQDSIGKPLANVSLTAYDSIGNGDGFVFTKRDGKYSIPLTCNKSYELEIEHLKHQSIVLPIRATKGEKDRVISMRKSSTTLKEVVVKAMIPVKVKGDTLEYNTEFFKTGTEENMKDVLRKLPGVTVDNGKVYYQGKEIKNITVEGREIFGGNTKLLNNNLPSDAIDKIQINKRFKSNPFASAIQQDEDFSLNVVLKDNKKSLLFGNATVGTNFKEHHKAQAKLFYFDKSLDGTVIYDHNTFGEEVFDREDYLQFMGGISEFLQEKGRPILQDNNFPLAFGEASNALKTRSDIAALSLGYTPNKKWYVNSFILGTNSKREYNTQTDRFLENTVFRQVANEVQELQTAFAQIRVDYNPSSKQQFKYRLNTNLQGAENAQTISNFAGAQDALLAQGFLFLDSDRTYATIRNKFSWIGKIGTDDNYGLYLSHNYIKDRPDAQYQSDALLFGALFPTQTSEEGQYSLSQNLTQKKHTTEAFAVYNHLLHPRSNIKLKVGTTFSSQKLNNTIYSFGVIQDDLNQQMNTEFTYADVFADLQWTQEFGKWRLDAGFALQPYWDSITDDGTEVSGLKDTPWLPYAKLRYEWFSDRVFEFNYSTTVSIPDLYQRSTGIQLQDAFTVFQGNAMLHRQKNEQFSMSYRNFNIRKLLTLNTYFSYIKGNDPIQNASFFLDTNYQINSPVNSPEDAQTFYFQANVDKRFNKTISLKAGTTVSYSDYVTFLQNSSELLENTIANYTASLTQNIRIKKAVELDLGLRFSYSDYESNAAVFASSVENTFTTWRPFTKLAWRINKDLLFQSNYSYTYQKSNGNELNSFQDLGASLRYKLWKNTYVSLLSGNLLDSELVRNSFNNNVTEIVRQDRLGPYFLVQLKYKF